MNIPLTKEEGSYTYSLRVGSKNPSPCMPCDLPKELVEFSSCMRKVPYPQSSFCQVFELTEDVTLCIRCLLSFSNKVTAISKFTRSLHQVRTKDLEWDGSGNLSLVHWTLIPKTSPFLVLTSTHMFKFMITFTLCFKMGEAHSWKTFPKPHPMPLLSGVLPPC
jgi:hypothetical protein